MRVLMREKGENRSSLSKVGNKTVMKALPRCLLHPSFYLLLSFSFLSSLHNSFLNIQVLF